MLLNNKKLYLFDVDGVIKLGDNFIDGSLELFNKINEIGGKSIFITNNSTKGAKDYVNYFKKHNFNVDESNFLTALTITVNYLLENNKNDKIFVIGTKSLVNELKNNGLYVTEKYEENIDVVLIGYDIEFNYQKAVDVCKILQTQKVEFLATNEDIRCPVTYGFIPDCGSIVEMIKSATEKSPKYLGKPAPQMVLEALNQTGFSKKQTVVVGDRLYTDIACGINVNVDTIAVLTGETNIKEINSSNYKPTFIFESVKEILKDIEN